MSGRLLIPTLIPEWAFSPPPALNECESTRSLSRESSSQLKPTYHGIIESNVESIVSHIKPLISPIENESRRNINEFNLGSSIGYGQFGKVYKARFQKNIFAIKSIAKKPWNSQQYSMNQTMRQIKLWRQRGGGYSITGDEAVMMMNVQKCRWEIYILSKLRSNYVVQLQKCLDSPVSRSIWIVNEWCSLGELEWKRNSSDEIPLQWSQLLGSCNNVLTFVEKALQDLTEGLAYLRTQGCIHRDIKPSNILVDSREKILKISDFGCAILLPQALPFQDEWLPECFQVELNKIVGTPAFIAPELCQFGNPGADDVRDGFKLDVWSVGVTLYGLLYNELPFYGESEFDTYHKVMHKDLKHLLSGNKINDLIIGKMLEKDPQVRISTETLYESEVLCKRTPPRRQDKTKTITTAAAAAAVDKKSPTDRLPTGMQKFFAKFLKLKKKPKNKKNSILSTSKNSSGNINSPTDVIPTSDVTFSGPSPSPRPSPLPQNDDFSEPSLESSLSTFEEPVRVSDLFKQDSAPLNTQESLPPSSSGVVESPPSRFESEPRRVDEYGLPKSKENSHRIIGNVLSSPRTECSGLDDADEVLDYDDEPRRIDTCDLPQPHDYPVHSRQMSTELSEIPSSHGSFELKTPPELSKRTHSHQPSNSDRQTSRDISFINYSQPSFQVSTPEDSQDYNHYDTSVPSKQPSFQLSVPPDIIQERSPQPTNLTLQHSSGSKKLHRHQPNTSISTSSSSPIRIPTPMKALIHMGNSPVKEDPTTTPPTTNNDGSPPRDYDQIHRGNSLAHSKDISNFQNYIVHRGNADALPQDRHKSVLTEDLIEKYLNYADNS